MITEENFEQQMHSHEIKRNSNGIMKKIVKLALLILIAIISYVWVAEYAASPKTHAETIEALDEKRTQVLELTALSSALSMGVSALPDDMGTPIAEKLADISTYLMLILCAIFLEKYLVTLTGYAAFKILIPLACALFALNIFWNSEGCNKLAKKILVFGLAIFMVVPTSVSVSNLIESTYELSIEMPDEETEEDPQTDTIEENAESKGFWESIKSSAEDLLESVEDTVTESVENVEEEFNNIIEGVAVMIVTSCIMPIAVLFFFIWIIRIILEIDINVKIPKIKKK